MEFILISACLLGQAVRYDGSDKRCSHDVLQRWIRDGRVVPVCPEIAGGLAVPRPPAEIALGAGGAAVLAGAARVADATGLDISEPFMSGARKALDCARARNIRIAVLKESSPSCGTSRIYDGSFSNVQIPGLGVTAALLQQAGIHVFSEEQFAEADRLLKRLDAENAA